MTPTDTVAPSAADAVAQPPAGPPPELLYRHRYGLLGSMREVWRAREVTLALAERDFRARYKQAVLGVAWAFFTPLVLMVVFTVFFRRVAVIDTSGVPYAVFCYVGLLGWTFMSASLSTGGMSLLNNTSLLNKVYCPREIFPISSVLVAAADTALAVVAGVALFVITGTVPAVTSLWLPVLLLIQVALTLAVVLLASILVVFLRDLRHLIPIALQLGLIASPVAYGIDDFIPDDLQWIYALANPLAPLLDGYRRTILLGEAPQWDLVGLAALSTAVLLAVAYTAFKRFEPGIADVA